MTALTIALPFSSGIVDYSKVSLCSALASLLLRIAKHVEKNDQDSP
jgi:hypothetical protein